MASYSNNENIMLSGQTAYFKKTGTMTNHGVLNIDNALTAHTYAEGYIGPNSVIHGTDLATTSDYINTETDMRTFLTNDWEEVQNERTVYTNANNIATALSSHKTAMQAYADSLDLDYYILEYIQGTGTQYINTGVTQNSNLSVEIVAQMNANNTQDVLFGANASNDLNRYTVRSWPTNSIYFYTANSGWNNATVTLTQKHTYKTVKYKLYVDGTLAVTASNTTFTGTQPLFLFGRNNNGSLETATCARMKLFSCKIWNNDTLVRDLIPVQRTSDFAICMYDKVNDTYFTNAGTGVFTAGPIIG